MRGHLTYLNSQGVPSLFIKFNLEKTRKLRTVLSAEVLAQMRSRLRSVVMEGAGKLVAEVSGESGGSAAAPIWRDFMLAARDH